jgi:hypothetical protein
VPARRDRRRHLMDQRRSCPAPGRPKIGESLFGARPRCGGDGPVTIDHRRGSGNAPFPEGALPLTRDDRYSCTT